MKQRGLFDENDKLKVISSLGDSLEKLDKLIDWEIFRPVLTDILARKIESKAGRPPFDNILMFKILILQRMYNISDDQMEFQINDRLSFMRFLGLDLNDKVPDAKTIWLFRERLVKANSAEKLFNRFNEELENHNLVGKKGRIIDATFVEVPKQRNSREENKTIKKGAIPEEWQEEKNKNKLAQKDTDARWAKKNNQTFYGYKDHVKVDIKNKFILEGKTTSASVHDSKEVKNLTNEGDYVLYADSAYIGKEIEKDLKSKKIKNKISERGTRNNPLTEEQKKNNRRKSKIRSRVEHVFGYMTNSMGGIYLRSIGFKRANFSITMMNLTYNLCRYRAVTSRI